MQGDQKPPHAVMMEFISGPWIAQAIYVVAKLGVADRIAAGATGVKQIAADLSVSADALARVLRALSVVGVVADQGDGKFGLTPLGETLRAGAPGGIRQMAIMFGEDFHWRPTGAMLHSVRTGQPAFDHVFGKGAFEYWSENQADGQIFNDAMTEFSKGGAPALVGAYDFSKCRKIVDIGGGHGMLLSAILAVNPGATGVLYDMPGVVAGAKLEGPAAGRIACEGGSFFDSAPAGGDTYMMKHILHDWDDERCLKILAAIRKVIPKDGTLLVAEMVVPGAGEPHFAKLLDLEMLLMTGGGRERTAAEFAALFANGGFKLSRVVPTPSPMSWIEGKPA